MRGKKSSELGASGNWAKGYVYLGGQMLAIQNGAVNWVHQDPVTKSQRVTNSSGAVISTIDLDPWGGETNRSANSAFQPHKYTTYERDGNGGDDAMMRRYQSNWNRFSQPDPYDGSYDATNPQSFNRYSYVQNDPVNFVDQSGLCSFSVALGNQSNISADQLQAMMSRISEIFVAAGQQINFLPANARGSDFNLTVYSSVAASGRTELPRTVGSTDRLGSGISNVGRLYVDRLTNSATSTTMGRIMFPLSPNFLGFGLGTAAAHEIGHRLLQQNFDREGILGIMNGSFGGTQWFGAIRTFNAAQIMRLNSWCAPITTDTTVPNTSPTMRPVIGGGGGRDREMRPILIGGGGFGGFDSLRWLDLWFASMRDGGGYVEVVGYRLNPPQ